MRRLLLLVPLLFGCGAEPTRAHVTGVVVTGQSLAVGEQGRPVVSTEQPFDNVKLFDSTGAYNASGDLSLVPLTALLRPVPTDYTKPYEYPDNIIGETPGEGMANQLAALDGRVVAVTNVGETAHPLAYLEKGGTGRAYASTLYEVGAIKRLVEQDGGTYSVDAVLLVHGEADALDPTYEARIEQLRADYDADIKAITGQSNDVVMVMSPQTTMPNVGGPSLTGIAEWHLAQKDPVHFVLAGPKYQYTYADDHIHLVAEGYRRLGQKAAEALAAHESGRSLALVPVDVARRSPTEIAVTFSVSTPPLRWDESLSAHAGTPAWANGHGFEVMTDAGAAVIDSVRIEGSTVVLLLASPVGADAVVSYAAYQDSDGFHGGLPEGRRGQLCDSDTFISYTGEPQANHAVAFTWSIQ